MGRWAKQPFDPRTRRLASVERPETWGSFDQALALVEDHQFDGLGLVLGFGLVEGNPHRLTAFDFDHSVEPSTRQIIPAVRYHLSKLNSYTEYSPSGTGLHTFCLADLGPGRNKRGDVEVYHQGRYIAMTGHLVEGMPTTIEQRHGEACILRRDWIGSSPTPRPAAGGVGDASTPPSRSCADVMEAMRRSANWSKIAGLMDRQRDGSRDESVADMSLLCHFCFYCGGDAKQMEELWKLSRCWGIHSTGDDYVQRTIAKAKEFLGGKRCRRGSRYKERPDGASNNGQGRPYYANGQTEERTQVGGSGGPETEHRCRTFTSSAGETSTPPGNLGVPSEHSSTPPPVSSSSAESSPSAPGEPGWRGRVASSIQEVEPEWFVPGWIPRSCLSFVIGRPGIGKSSYLASLMAKARRAILLPGYEESIDMKVLRRLRAHGVNLDNLLVLDDKAYSLDLHSEEITRAAFCWRADLIVLDPVDSYLGDDASENDGQKVRPILEKASQMAQRTGAAVVGSRHPGKGPDNLMVGSRQWEAVPRHIIELLPDGGRPERRIMQLHKPRGCKEPGPTYFDVVEVQAGQWVFTLGDAVKPEVVDLAKAMTDPMDRSEHDQACKLLALLLEGGEMESKEIYQEGEKERITPRTMRWAKKTLGILDRREGSGKGHKSYWKKP